MPETTITHANHNSEFKLVLQKNFREDLRFQEKLS